MLWLATAAADQSPTSAERRHDQGSAAAAANERWLPEAPAAEPGAPTSGSEESATAGSGASGSSASGATPVSVPPPQQDSSGRQPISPPAAPAIIESVTTITDNGARLDWSTALDQIAFDKRGEDGFYDIYTMRPDGSAQTCLTCDAPGLPGRHMGNPAWHPSGGYIAFQAEKAVHPGGSYGATPGIGMDNNLWVMTSDGGAAWQLTDLSDKRSVLHPHFSRDGARLLWSEGLSLKVADFVTSPEPHLENVQKFRPGGLVFHEAHGFSPLDDSTVLFSGPLETDQPAWAMDVYRFSYVTGEMVNLTSTTDQWDEHAQYSPSGRTIAWMSSAGCDCEPSRPRSLETDIWLMDPDGSNKTRLTRFSDPQSPHYVGRKVVVGDMSWSPDGKRLAARLIVGWREHIVIIEFSSAQ